MLRPGFRSWIGFILLLGIVLAAPVEGRAGEPLDGLDAYIDQGMKDWEVPGLAIAVVKDDVVVYSKGFGIREVGKPDRVTPETLFAVASNTKAVTATALGLLVGEGKLRWDDPVARTLPGFALSDPAATRSLTIRDLLCHRVGLGTWQGDLIWYGSDRSRAEVLERVRYLEPSYGFRDRFGYCNLTFIAAGEVIAAVSGSSWEAFVRSRLIEPLGMTRTNLSVRELDRVENTARPHTKIDGQVTAIPYRNLDNTGPAGGINSCVQDWTRWMRLQLAEGSLDGKVIVPREIVRETQSPQHLIRPVNDRIRRLFPTSHFFAYGLGWFLQDYQGRFVVHHSGGMDGMLSYTLLVPEEKLGVVVLTNQDEQELYRALPFRVIDAFLNLPPRDWSAELLQSRRDRGASPRPDDGAPDDPRPSLDLKRYAGTYRHPALGEARIVWNDGTLRLEIERHPGLTAALTHRHSDVFEATWADRYLRTSAIPFRLDAMGRPVEFRMVVRPDFIDPMEYVFVRSR